MKVFPDTLDRLTHTIQMLQHLQSVLPLSATLSDAVDVFACLESEYEMEMLLEDVIQRLVREHLATQLAQRGALRSSHLVQAYG